MRYLITFILAICFALLVSCQHPKSPAHDEEPLKSIGAITMERDGTLTVELRAAGEDKEGGEIGGEAMFRYTRKDKEYRTYLEHVGGLKKEESKIIPPFLEDPAS